MEAPTKPTATASTRPLPEWGSLSFALTETDFMFHASGDKRRDPVWSPGKYLPFGEMTISPAASVLSYGLGVFEGLKAQRTADGRVLLFRHGDNAERFRRSAERLMLPPYPAEDFVAAVEGIVARNLRFVPPAGKGSFYVRPMEHAVEPKLGLGPCNHFQVTMYGSPVGSYFAGGVPKGVRLEVVEQGRVAPGGTGSAKCMGNYAGGIYVAHQAKQKGFDDVLYLDARHVRFVTETSGSNVFIKKSNGVIVAPPLDDQILAGVTRDSTIQVARRILGLEVQERPIPIEELLDDADEMFCTGTAWTIQSIREVVYRGVSRPFAGDTTRRALLEELLGIQTGARKDPFGWTHEVRPS
jgi:branched-chain amino acid aminotransferase